MLPSVLPYNFVNIFHREISPLSISLINSLQFTDDRSEWFQSESGRLGRCCSQFEQVRHEEKPDNHWQKTVQGILHSPLWSQQSISYVEGFLKLQDKPSEIETFIESTLSHVMFTKDLPQGIDGSQLIIEAIAEKIEAKQALFRTIDKVLKINFHQFNT